MPKIKGYADENNRRDVRAPMDAVEFGVGGATYPVLNISVGGFMLGRAAGKMTVGKKFTVTSVKVGDGPLFRTSLPAQVVRIDYADAALGCKFGKLTAEQFRVAEQLVLRRPLGAPGQQKKGFFSKLFGD